MDSLPVAVLYHECDFFYFSAFPQTVWYWQFGCLLLYFGHMYTIQNCFSWKLLSAEIMWSCLFFFSFQNVWVVENWIPLSSKLHWTVTQLLQLRCFSSLSNVSRKSIYVIDIQCYPNLWVCEKIHWNLSNDHKVKNMWYCAEVRAFMSDFLG